MTGSSFCPAPLLSPWCINQSDPLKTLSQSMTFSAQNLTEFKRKGPHSAVWAGHHRHAVSSRICDVGRCCPLANSLPACASLLAVSRAAERALASGLLHLLHPSCGVRMARFPHFILWSLFYVTFLWGFPRSSFKFQPTLPNCPYFIIFFLSNFHHWI